MRGTLALIGAASGAGLGVLASTLDPRPGWLVWVTEYVTEPIGQLFLRLLFMLVVPLLFAAIVVGIADLEVRNLGRMGARMLGYTVAVSAIAVFIGVFLVNTLRPGDGVRPPAETSAAPIVEPAGAGPESAIDRLLAIVPDNPVRAAAEGDMLALIVFALLFGIALSRARTENAAALKRSIAGLYDVMMKLIDGVLVLMPVAVAALLFTTTVRLGGAVLVQLAGYVGVVLLALAVHQFGVYSLSVRLLGGMSPVRFFVGIKEAMLTAFSTSSSSATLPTALRVAESDLELSPAVSRFVLTAGSAMNQNGTALFEGVTVLFLAQLYDVELSVGQQIVVVLICILGGIGTAGVPAGSLPVVATILAMYRIPPEGLGLVIGVDRLLDMCRTVVNVTGDLAAAVYIGRRARDEPGA